MLRRVSVLSLPILAACGGAGSEVGATWDDVSPILESKCTSCHQVGGPGRFAMSTYAETTPWAEAIANAVESRTMPPWLVVDDGSCGTFEDSQTLSDDEIAAVVDWARNGTPEGENPDRVLTPEPLIGLSKVDRAIQTPEIVPISEDDTFAPTDEYRCFLVENDAGKDQFLTGYEVIPGNAAIVHHVLGMPLDLAADSWTGVTSNGEELVLMDGVDGRPGWDCLGTAGGNLRESGIPVSWAPGQGAVTYPDGVGVRLRADDVFVVQVHYSLADPFRRGESDSSQVLLRLEDSVEHEAYMALPDAFLMSIFNFPNVDTLPEGRESVKYSWTMSVPDLLWGAYVPAANTVERVKVYQVGPHMHQRGRSMRVDVLRDGKNSDKECLVDVPDWDFNWQLVYRYGTPVELTANDSIKVTCQYDTSDMDVPVWPGWGTSNEMCLVAMLLTVDE